MRRTAGSRCAATSDLSIRGGWSTCSSPGIVCGLLWECWNYWAHTKWVYTVPVPPHVKLFEMPLAGYLGFPAFAVECFVMYVFTRRWLWRGSWRPTAL
jgi:hypothetical protein